MVQFKESFAAKIETPTVLHYGKSV